MVNLSRRVAPTGTVSTELPAKSGNAGLIARGNIAPIDVTAILENPSAATGSQNLVTYLAPAGVVAEIKELAIVFSEPVLSKMQVIGWRVTVNGATVPGIVTNAGLASLQYNFASCRDIFSPIKLAAPIIVQAGQVVAIEVTPLASFAAHVTVTGRLVGILKLLTAGV